MDSLKSCIPLLLCAVYLALGTFMMRHFPPVNLDEMIVMVNGYNYLHDGHIHYSLNDDLFDRSVYNLRDLSNHIARPLFDGWVGLWVRIISRQAWVARGSALSMGTLVLLSFYFIGKKISGPPLGTGLMLICLANPVFWAASSVVNEHILMLLMGNLFLFLLLHEPPARGWSNFGMGLAAAVPMFIHQNMLALGLAFLVFLLVLYPRQRHLGLVISLGSGFGAGIILFSRLVDWNRFVLFQKAIYWNFAKPPILTWPWTPLAWIQRTGTAWITGPTFYFSRVGDILPSWTWSLTAFWLAAGVLGVAAKMTSPAESPANPLRSLQKALTWGMVGIFSGICLFVQRAEIFYVLMLLPFLIPWMGLAWVRLSAGTIQRLLKGGAATLLLASISLFAYFGFTYTRLCVSLPEIIQRLHTLTGNPEARTAGPNVLWPFYPPEHFRDIAATVVSRYYTDHPDLREFLKDWQPENLIVEETFRRAYRLPHGDSARLAALLQIPVEALGEIDTRYAYGVWDVYRLRWDKYRER